MSVKELYEKVDAFEARLSDKARSFSQCKKGCSQCCKVDLSVFSVEARAIRLWFSSLSPEKKSELKNLWGSEVPGECAFLKDNACTIYEARPLICRSQGLPLRYVEAGESWLDVCPLNEDMLKVALATEIVNLDLLNLLLSKIESQSGSGERIRLKDLRDDLLNER